MPFNISFSITWLLNHLGLLFLNNKKETNGTARLEAQQVAFCFASFLLPNKKKMMF